MQVCFEKSMMFILFDGLRSNLVNARNFEIVVDHALLIQ